MAEIIVFHHARGLTDGVLAFAERLVVHELLAQGLYLVIRVHKHFAELRDGMLEMRVVL